MNFYKDKDGNPQVFYRGECTHPAFDIPKTRLRAMYFGDVETANIYSEMSECSGNYYTSRVFPVHLILERPFIDTPDDPFLELRDVVERLGSSEACRIAIRFAKYIEETDHWTERLNPNKNFKGVADFLYQGGDVKDLYFQAYRFFDSLMEVNRIRRIGYDGAIHAGSGIGSAHKPEFCVFSDKQVFFTASKTFLG